MRDIAPSVSVKDVVIAVSREADIPTEALLGRSKVSPLPRWRNLAFLLAHELAHQPYTEIGRAMDRNHSTVHYGCQRTKKDMETDHALRFTYDKLKSELRG